MISSTTTSNSSSVACQSPSLPFEAATTTQPSARSPADSAAGNRDSSSTSRPVICALSFQAAWPARHGAPRVPPSPCVNDERDGPGTWRADHLPVGYPATLLYLGRY